MFWQEFGHWGPGHLRRPQQSREQAGWQIQHFRSHQLSVVPNAKAQLQRGYPSQDSRVLARTADDDLPPGRSRDPIPSCWCSSDWSVLLPTHAPCVVTILCSKGRHHQRFRTHAVQCRRFFSGSAGCACLPAVPVEARGSPARKGQYLKSRRPRQVSELISRHWCSTNVVMVISVALHGHRTLVEYCGELLEHPQTPSRVPVVCQ